VSPRCLLIDGVLTHNYYNHRGRRGDTDSKNATTR